MSDNFLISLGVGMMLLLALGIIFFVILYQRRVINHQMELREFNRQKQIELMQAAIRSEEDERMRIATELHDDVGATLSSVRLFLTQAARYPNNPEYITQTKELLDSTIQKVRDISHQLQPGTLQYLGLIKALQSLAETINRAGTIQIDFVLQRKDWPEPDAQTSLSIYRIVQELVNNIVKHTNATFVHLSAQMHEGKHCIVITHNGIGLSAKEYEMNLHKKGAIGLKNIENRIKTANLSLIFPNPADTFYSIMICLPNLPSTS